MKNKEFKFKYIFPDDYNPQYANGAYGGVSDRGEIVINFYFERIGIPYYQTQMVDEKGKLDDEKKIEPKDLENSRIRYIQNGVVLDIHSAKQIHAFLDRMIKSYDQQKSKL